MTQIISIPEAYKFIFIFAIIVVSIIFKVLHDVFQYLCDIARQNVYNLVEAGRNKAAMVRYGKMYHWFGFLAVVTPFTISLVVQFTLFQFAVAALAYAGIYSFLMSFLFNIIAGKNWFYIGKTEAIDIWLRKVLNISYKGDPGYEDLSAKQKQWGNFKKSFIYFIRFALMLGGYVLLEQMYY